MNYMKKFADIPQIKKFKNEIKYCPDNDSHCSYLCIENPHILVRFAGYLKLQNVGSKVLFRGQNNDHGKMIPSLFRDDRITDITLKNRDSAYNDLLEKLKKTTPNRFKNDNLGTILQHYGIKTPYLDLVDNIYTAIWFATMKKTEKEPFKYLERKNGDGWIYFIKIKENDLELEFCDLREEQSSLSLRLHAQHGISIKRQGEAWRLTNRDLNKFVVAKVKFTINDSWRLKGQLFDTKFMFPSTYYDNTYKYLKTVKFSKLIDSVAEEFKLSKGDLGKIEEYGTKSKHFKELKTKFT